MIVHIARQTSHHTLPFLSMPVHTVYNYMKFLVKGISELWTTVNRVIISCHGQGETCRIFCRGKLVLTGLFAQANKCAAVTT